jgi:hypothetical protein
VTMLPELPWDVDVTPLNHCESACELDRRIIAQYVAKIIKRRPLFDECCEVLELHAGYYSLGIDRGPLNYTYVAMVPLTDGRRQLRFTGILPLT